MDREEFVALADAMIGNGASAETVLVALRMEGASQGECALTLGRIGRWSVAEVKGIVESSAAWSDHVERRAEFVRNVVEFLDSEHGAED